MFIDGIGISRYRSFGSKLQKIGPFGKINFFIGQNNSGKSNILSFLVDKYNRIGSSSPQPNLTNLKFNELDYHIGISRDSKIQLAAALKISGENHKSLYESLKKQCEESYIKNRNLYYVIERILKSETLSDGGDTTWFPYEVGVTSQSFNFPSDDLVEQIISENILTEGEWRELWRALSGRSGGNIKQHWIREVLRFLFPTPFQQPTVRIIPSHRNATTKLHDGHSQIDFIHELDRRQNPTYSELHLKKQFEAINRFLQQVVGNPTAKLEIPHTRDIIQVNIDDKTLPLSHLGMGINKTIILAIITTIRRDEVLCIEEPEENLHPLAQKKLIRYLAEKTDNQYFIATHSPHFLDMSGAHIFHVRLEDGESIVKGVQTADDRFSICADLGYRASDLLQTNCVIWVEGPSDRIYVKHWIQAVDDELVEGIHYSIMFYGGDTYRGLTAEDPEDSSEIENLISVCRLNRNSVLIIDSDCSESNEPLEDVKKKLCKEFDNGLGFSWVTKGREIENYIEEETFEKAVKKAHPNVSRDAARLVETGQFADFFRWETVDGKKIKPRKVLVAREVIKQPANLKILGLKTQVEKLVKFIRQVNDFENSS